VPRNVVYLLLCAVLVATGAPMAGQYFAQSPPPALPQRPPPAPPFSLAPSPPVSVRASVVGINSVVSQVGLTKDGTIEVPTSYDCDDERVPPRTHPRVSWGRR